MESEKEEEYGVKKRGRPKSKPTGQQQKKRRRKSAPPKIKQETTDDDKAVAEKTKKKRKTAKKETGISEDQVKVKSFDLISIPV